MMDKNIKLVNLVIILFSMNVVGMKYEDLDNLDNLDNLSNSVKEVIAEYYGYSPGQRKNLIDTAVVKTGVEFRTISLNIKHKKKDEKQECNIRGEQLNINDLQEIIRQDKAKIFEHIKKDVEQNNPEILAKEVLLAANIFALFENKPNDNLQLTTNSIRLPTVISFIDQTYKDNNELEKISGDCEKISQLPSTIFNELKGDYNIQDDVKNATRKTISDRSSIYICDTYPSDENTDNKANLVKPSEMGVTAAILVIATYLLWGQEGDKFSKTYFKNIIANTKYAYQNEKDCVAEYDANIISNKYNLCMKKEKEKEKDISQQRLKRALKIEQYYLKAKIPSISCDKGREGCGKKKLEEEKYQEFLPCGHLFKLLPGESCADLDCYTHCPVSKCKKKVSAIVNVLIP